MRPTADIAKTDRIVVTFESTGTTPAAADDLIREISRLRLCLALARHEYGDLLAAARACVAAAARGEADPLFWITDELRSHGQLPAPLSIPEQIAAATHPALVP